MMRLILIVLCSLGTLNANPLLKQFSKLEIKKITDACVRNNLTEKSLITFVYAIRKAEGQRNDKYQFGIKHPRCSITDFNQQAGWAAATVKNHHQRFVTQGGRATDYKAFTSSLAKRYAPVGVANDPKNLNKNWESNVWYWHQKLSSKD